MGSARHLLTEGKGPEAPLPRLQGSIDHGTMRCALATVGGVVMLQVPLRRLWLDLC